eukprot:6393906-Amphidinium_carterae.1
MEPSHFVKTCENPAFWCRLNDVNIPPTNTTWNGNKQQLQAKTSCRPFTATILVLVESVNARALYNCPLLFCALPQQLHDHSS